MTHYLHVELVGGYASPPPLSGVKSVAKISRRDGVPGKRYEFELLERLERFYVKVDPELPAMTEGQMEELVHDIHVTQPSDRTVTVTIELASQFEITQSCTTLESHLFDYEEAVDIALEKCFLKLVGHLSFTYMWAKNGLIHPSLDTTNAYNI